MQSTAKDKRRLLPLPFRNRGQGKKLLFLWLLLPTAYVCSAQNITLTVKNAPFETVVKQIGAQAGLQPVYVHETIEKGKPVTVTLKKASLKEALETVFRNQPLTYSIEEGHILIKVKDEKKLTPALPEVRGMVRDESGAPVAGATIQVKGTDIATSTNSDGLFTLYGVRPDAVLGISSIGYQKQQVRLNGETVIEVQLSFAVNPMDETVVIAYGTTTKRLNTGSVSRVTAEEIGKQPVSNPLAALEGRMPGVFVTQTSGLPGANINLRIRGQNSIGAGNDPLYIVDGVPFTSTPLNGTLVNFNGANGQVSPFNSINPSDIESVEVLKDADATALYGSRGANGVVLITTKRGKVGKTKVSATIYSGFSKVSQFLHYFNTEEYLQLRREAFMHDGSTPTTSNAPDLLVWDTTQYTNWAKRLMGGTAHITNLQAGVSGGNEATYFLFSSNFHKEGTVLPGDFGYRRAGARLQAGHTSEDKRFATTLQVYYSTDQNRLIKSSLIPLIGLPPNFPIYDNSGNYNWTGGDNPEAYLKRLSKSRTENITSNAAFTYTLLPGLQIKTDLGYTSLDMDQVLTMPIASQKPSATVKNSAYFGKNRITTYQVEPRIDYTTGIGKGNLKVLAGSTWNRSITKGNYLQGDNYANESFLESISAAGTISSRIDQHADYKFASFFSRFNYTWERKYLLNASFRRDGSSRFGPEKEWGNFGAVGLGWIFSEAGFVKKGMPFLSFGKLRASYGLTGNDQIPDYQYLLTYSSGAVYGGSGTLGPSRIENPHYSWETNRKLEAALETGFFTDRLMLTTAWFRNRSSNLLVPYPLPGLSGFSSYQANLPGLVQNTGWEISMNYTSRKTKQWQWSSSFNVTVPQNRLLDYPGLPSSVYANTYVVGQDLSVKKGYLYLGTDPATGIAQFADINEDGKITNPADFVIIGKTSPDYYGGFQNSVSYKNFQLDIFLQFVKQMGVGYSDAAGTMSNRLVTALERWQKPGGQTAVPRPSATAGNPAYQSNINVILSDAVFEKATYLRFKNLQLSYKLPLPLLQKLKGEQCRFYLQAQNLFTVTRYKQLDPETQGGNVPPLKTMTAGIQINF